MKRTWWKQILASLKLYLLNLGFAVSRSDTFFYEQFQSTFTHAQSQYHRLFSYQNHVYNDAYTFFLLFSSTPQVLLYFFQLISTQRLIVQTIELYCALKLLFVVNAFVVFLLETIRNHNLYAQYLCCSLICSHFKFCSSSRHQWSQFRLKISPAFASRKQLVFKFILSQLRVQNWLGYPLLNQESFREIF